MFRSIVLLLFVSLGLMMGCGGSATPTVKLTLASTTVAPGEKLNITITLTNFTLAESGSHAGHGRDENKAATSNTGHYHLYIDNGSPTMAHTATKELEVPATTTEGTHKLRIELVDSNHTPLNPSVEDTIEFTVKKK